MTTPFPHLQGLSDPTATVKQELEGGGFSVLTATPPAKFVVKVQYFGVWTFRDGQTVVATRLIEGAYGLRFKNEPVSKLKAAFKEQGVREKSGTYTDNSLWKVETTEALGVVRDILTREHGRLTATSSPSIAEIIAADLLFGDWTAPNGRQNTPIDGQDPRRHVGTSIRTGRTRRDSALPV